jgi:hypothetical protein
MTVQDVYALVTLMGLYLSEASCHQKAYKELLALTTVTPSRSTRCNTRSSGSLVLTSYVLSRSQTQSTLRYATTTALVAVTPVARHPVLRARFRPLDHTPLATQAALVALILPLSFLSTPSVATLASTRNTTFLPTSFRATALALTKFLLTMISTVSATPTPGRPSLAILPTTPRRSPPTTTPRDFFIFFFSLSCCWERTGILRRRVLNVEGCCFVRERECCLLVLNLVSSTLPCIRRPRPRLSVFLSVFLSLRTGSTSFRYQMVCAIYLEIIIPHLCLCVV